MAFLPSYNDATTRLDWLGLVASYCSVRDYHALCLVSRRFRDVFAPLLWRDLLQAVRSSGLDSGDDLTWWFDFVFEKLDAIPDSTRGLVRILDARTFTKDSYDFSSDQQERTVTGSFKRALSRLPFVNSILLDGHEDIDLAFLNGDRSYKPNNGNLRLLSIADCSYQLPSSFFNASHFQSLIYLDVSNLPGSISPLVQPTVLPALKILKARGRELDDSAVHALISHFGLRLWSLDISNNKITDDIVQDLRNWCLPVSQLRTYAHSQVEGQVVVQSEGTSDYGSFMFIDESDCSGSFSHPERYFADAPTYTVRPDVSAQEHWQVRSDGSLPTRMDTADAVKGSLSSGDAVIRIDEYQQLGGTTHLRLSDNAVSSMGVQKLFRISNGHIENFACDSMPFLPRTRRHRKQSLPSAGFFGILGASHYFRPVFSSNLQVLRIHHSLITNILTLHTDAMSSLACEFVAETAILRRADQAYPLKFIPDMNPRLRSLTLTRLPRRTSGPLISRLMKFLKLLSLQERDIQVVSSNSSTRHSPKLLKGLRHLRLEFESDSMEEGCDTYNDLDAVGLMNSGEKMFSFFDDEQAEETRRQTRLRSLVREGLDSKSVPDGGSAASPSRISVSDQDNVEFVEYDGCWNGEAFSLKVWVGPRDREASDVVADYRRLVLEQNLRDGVGPATPAQILAGAPKRSYIFQVAWSVAALPSELIPPTQDQLMGMEDVLDALKTYRQKGRAMYMQQQELAQLDGRCVPLGPPHYFWTGRLEVAADTQSPRRDERSV